MNKKFAIFDMDGTLINSMDYWCNLGREYLYKYGITENIEDILEEVGTKTMSQGSKLFADNFDGLPGVPEIISELRTMIADHYKKDVVTKPGVIEYLEALHNQGVRMCLASATDVNLVVLVMKRLGIDKYFEFMLSCEEIGKGKDEPDIYLEAARRLGCKPEEAAVYEDVFYSANTAKKAGFYTIAVADVNATKEWDSLTAIADEIIIDWKKSLKCIPPLY